MPRKPIDYSNTIIYKLGCKDPSITDIYIGHTTNFTNRKQCHKQSCNTENTRKHNYYVYQFIRENGGWNNWEMIQIERINCVDDIEARTHERRHLELLGATLNKVLPTRTKKEYVENNKESIQKLKQDWYIKNKEITLSRAKTRYTQNLEYIKEYNKTYHSNEANKERVKQQRKNKRINEKLKKLEIIS
jgi:hypothetical protein